MEASDSWKLVCTCEHTPPHTHTLHIHPFHSASIYWVLRMCRVCWPGSPTLTEWDPVPGFIELIPWWQKQKISKWSANKYCEENELSLRKWRKRGQQGGDPSTDPASSWRTPLVRGVGNRVTDTRQVAPCPPPLRGQGRGGKVTREIRK